MVNSTTNFDHLLLKDLSNELEETDRYAFACGGFSDVYLYRSIDAGSDKPALYAVKCLRPYGKATDMIVKKVKREIYTWTRLRHPNVLQLHGFLTRPGYPFPCLVSGFMKNGTAKTYLLNKIERARFWPFIRGISRGLSHLHQNGVVHRDIKADNILTSDSGDALICDLGLSTMINPREAGFTTTSDGNGGGRWTAVEYFDLDNGPEHPTKAGDVSMFGSTCLELWSGQHPYYDITKELLVVRKLIDGELPKFPPKPQREDFERYKEPVELLCTLCWLRDPTLRPAMATLEALLDSFCLKYDPESAVSVEDVVASPGASVIGHDENDINFDRQASGSENSGVNLTTNIERGTQTRASSLFAISSDIFDVENPWVSVNAPNDQVDSVNSERSEPSVSQVHAGDDAVPSIGDDLNSGPTKRWPWLEVPSLPLPSVETMLKHISMTAQSILHDHFQGRRQFNQPEYEDGMSTSGAHTVVCLIDHEEYGRAEDWRKKRAKEMAALLALEKMYSEEPAHFPRLRYLPVFKSHLGKRGFQCEWLGAFDQQSWIYKTTLTCNGAVLAGGSGPTREDAEEKAALNAVLIWPAGNEN